MTEQPSYKCGEIKLGLCWKKSCPYDTIGTIVHIPRRCPLQMIGPGNRITFCPEEIIGGTHR